MTADDGRLERSQFTEIDETTSAAPTAGLGYVETSRPYNPQERLDFVRSRLAFCLVALLMLAILGAFVLVITASAVGLRPEDVRLIVEVILTPLVALVSAATGFYFGAQLTDPRRKRDRR